MPDRPVHGYAKRVMRGIIIDHARRRQPLTEEAAFEITTLGDDISGVPIDADELVRISLADET